MYLSNYFYSKHFC